MGHRNSKVANNIVLTETVVDNQVTSSFVERGLYSDISHPPERRIIENFVIVWLDSTVQSLKSITHLQTITNSINTYITADDCVQFLTELKDEKVFMVIADDIIPQIMPRIEHMSQIYAIYVLSNNKEASELLTKEYSKVRGVFTDIESMYDPLKREIEQCDKNLISISILPPLKTFKIDFDRLDYSFIHAQLLKQFYLDMTCDVEAKKHLVDFCRVQYSDNDAELKVIDEFEQNYKPSSAILWYTRECFVYAMLNQALRTHDIEVMIKMIFLVQDIHQQLKKLHAQAAKTNRGPMITYRGQSMSNEDFEEIRKNRGGLLSFDNFLSTNTDQEISLVFARYARQVPNMMGVLFRIKFDSASKSATFALLGENSYSSEHAKDVLFSMYTAFRIDTFRHIEERVWQVELSLAPANTRQLTELIDNIREKIRGATEWHRLSQLMILMGKFSRAKDIYLELLKTTPEDDERKRALIYNQLGFISDEIGEYSTALSFYEKAIEVRQNSLPSNHRSLLSTFNNIGKVQQELGEYSTALSFYQRTLAIKERPHPLNNPLSRTVTYNNIGLVYELMGEYPTALSFYEKTLAIRKNYLSPDHPELATTYNNIGEVYRHMGKFSMALSYYRKTLRIRLKHLPHGHPTLAITYNNIGLAHSELGEYSTALSYFHKTLEIKQKSLAANHPSLANTYNNIGEVNQMMGEFSVALSYYQKGLIIRQKSFPPTHPELATSYNDIGEVYRLMGEFPNALSFYQKALDIQQKGLSPVHPSLAITYNNIGLVQQGMGEYTDALASYEKTLEIRQKSLPSTHPSLAGIYNCIGVVHQSMGDYSTALSFYEKTLAIQKQSLPTHHPELATTYNNMGLIHREMGEYSIALSYYQKTYEIKHKSLPANHSSMAITYNNMGETYQKMGEHSKALEFYQKAIQIQQKSLSPNHPSLAATYNNIAGVHQSTHDFPTALTFYRKALEIQQKSLSPKHPSLALTYNGLGTALIGIQDYRAAVENQERAVEIASHSLGPDHPHSKIFIDYLNRMRQKLNSVESQSRTSA